MQLFLFQIAITAAGFQLVPMRMRRSRMSQRSTQRMWVRENTRNNIETTKRVTCSNHSSEQVENFILKLIYWRWTLHISFRKILHQMPTGENFDRETRPRWCVGWKSATDIVQRQTNFQAALRIGDAFQQEASLYSSTWFALVHRPNHQQEELYNRACLPLEVQDYREKLWTVHSAKREHQSEVRHGRYLGIEMHVRMQEQRNLDSSRAGRLQRQLAVARRGTGLHNSAQ